MPAARLHEVNAAAPGWQSFPGGMVAISSQSPQTLAAVLEGAAGATLLKRDARSEVRRVEVDGRSWIVKRYSLPRWKQVVYQSARLSPAWREWRGAQRLGAAGVRVSMPVAIVRHAGGRGEVLVLPYVEGESLGDLLRRHSHDRAMDPRRRPWRS